MATKANILYRSTVPSSSATTGETANNAPLTNTQIDQNFWSLNKAIGDISAYSLPTASSTVLGGIKVGNNLSIDSNGLLSSSYVDTNTWDANTRTVAGYVAAPGAVSNKVWKTDTLGNPAWRDDADTIYSLPLAADGTRGGVQIGYTTNNKNYAVQLSGEKMYVNVPWTDTDTNTWDANALNVAGYVAAPISTTVNKVWKTDASGNPAWRDDADTNTWDANSKTVAGYVSAPGAVSNKVWKTDASGNPDWRDDADTVYSLPTASASVLGGIKVGTNLSIDVNGVLSSTDTNTTYSAGTGLTLSGTSFSVNYGSTSTTACAGNDGRLSDSRNAADVYAWAKAATKPSYNTGEVSESGNLYFTNARARSAISVSGSLSYNSSTGAISYTTPTSLPHNGTALTATTGTFSGDVSVTGAISATGNITSTSDIRVKTNLQKITSPLAKVDQLNGYTFDRTDIQTSRQTGVIAQEVLQVLPEAVSGNEEGYTVAYGNMMGLMIEAIKELNLKIQDLQNQLANK